MTKIQSIVHSISHGIKKITLTTPIAIIMGAVILGGSHIVYGLIVGTAGQTAQTAMFTGKPIDQADHIEGDSTSDVIIVEYSDPECPYCISLHPTLKQLRTTYGDRVGFVYRHFPLTQIHPNAYDESKAIACAGSLGGTKGYYAYIDSLYGYKINNQTAQLPETGKEDIAKNIGIDPVAFSACLTAVTTDAIIDTSLNDGLQAGVSGTPSTFILAKTRKGYEVVAMLDGARSEEYFKAAIDEALSR